MSINSGIVPDEMKFAWARPIFKKNSPLDVSNYRPVRILRIVSKILERSISTQLNDFIKENNLLYEYQSGFRGSYFNRHLSNPPSRLHQRQ